MGTRPAGSPRFAATYTTPLPSLSKRSGIGSFSRGTLRSKSERICVSDLFFILLRWISYLVYFVIKLLPRTFIWTKNIPSVFLTFSSFGCIPSTQIPAKPDEISLIFAGKSPTKKREIPRKSWKYRQNIFRSDKCPRQ